MKVQKHPFKFKVGDRVIIGDTVWGNDYPKMKDKIGETGTITNTAFLAGFGNGNQYEIDNGFYFEEDCLILEEEAKPVEEITNDEINDILQG